MFFLNSLYMSFKIQQIKYKYRFIINLRNLSTAKNIRLHIFLLDMLNYIWQTILVNHGKTGVRDCLRKMFFFITPM